MALHPVMGFKVGEVTILFLEMAVMTFWRVARETTILTVVQVLIPAFIFHREQIILY
ncbi:hypothetical protein M622_17825 [Thauera terpenica 58Eu]|uniref:Uncharacterized protein n=1 Tax=Thauera terpenica 58Eu TaxID=1348657 RepID=T0AVT9_9RHOO|nr:hypothetical protein M622_17825 [Thauera terpenica 58Eu]